MRYYHIPHPQFPEGLKLDVDAMAFAEGNDNMFSFLKGSFPRRHEFIAMLDGIGDDELSASIRKFMVKGYDKAKPFTYAEAFKLKNAEFRAIVFGSIDIRDMIASLGHERIHTDGMHVRQKKLSQDGRFLGWVEKDNIYELHKVSGKKLDLQGDIYAVKCWCTTTNEEHWLWVEQEYATDALTAISSTFRVHKNMIPHIKEIKRQGDILILEMKEQVKPDGDIVPLTKEQYFGLLTAES